MPVQAKSLRVLPNPWTYIDHRGRACGAVPCDYYEHTKERRFVGATLQATKVAGAVVEVVRGKQYERLPATHDVTFTFDVGPVKLPNTPYYREHVKRGELFAADAATAAECGIKFEAPEACEARARAEAIAAFDAANGIGAYDLLNSGED